MNHSLFRKEAVAARTEQQLGQTLAARPLALRVLVAWAAGLTLCALAYLCWGQHTRKEHVSGYLMPDKGLIRVFTPEPGVIVKQHVAEGDLVQQGQPLFSISLERGREQGGGSASAVIAMIKQRSEHLRAEESKLSAISTIEGGDTTARIKSLEQEALQMEGQVAAQLNRVEIAQAALARSKKLHEQGYLSEPQLQVHRDQALEQQDRLNEFRRSQISIEREIQTLRKNYSAGALKQQTQSLSALRAQQELAQQVAEYEQRRTFTITAPVSGRVASTLAQVGQMAATNTPLLTVLPDGHRLEAHLLVPTRAAGFIQLNQTVQIRYHAYPYQRFGSHAGRIVEIDHNSTRGGDSVLVANTSEPVYLVTVRLDRQDLDAYGKRIPLKTGLAVDADIAIDTRTLLAWLLDPVYSIAGRL